jgi:hypothetical protein
MWKVTFKPTAFRICALYRHYSEILSDSISAPVQCGRQAVLDASKKGKRVPNEDIHVVERTEV